MLESRQFLPASALNKLVPLWYWFLMAYRLHSFQLPPTSPRHDAVLRFPSVTAIGPIPAAPVASKCSSLMAARVCQLLDCLNVTPISASVGLETSTSEVAVFDGRPPSLFSVTANISPARRWARARISVAKALPGVPVHSVNLSKQHGTDNATRNKCA